MSYPSFFMALFLLLNLAYISQIWAQAYQTCSTCLISKQQVKINGTISVALKQRVPALALMTPTMPVLRPGAHSSTNPNDPNHARTQARSTFFH